MRKTPLTEGLRGPDSVSVQEFAIHILSGPDKGLVHIVKEGRVTIGTHRAADLQLSDSTLSRFPCEIALMGGKATIRDLGSRNGTLVEGVSIEVAHLRDRQVLTLGRTQLRLDLGE